VKTTVFNWKKRTSHRIFFDVTRGIIFLLFLCWISISVYAVVTHFGQDSSQRKNVSIRKVSENSVDYHLIDAITWDSLKIAYPSNWKHITEKINGMDIFTLHPNASSMYGIHIWSDRTHRADKQWKKSAFFKNLSLNSIQRIPLIGSTQGFRHYQLDYLSRSGILMRAEFIYLSSTEKDVRFLCFAPHIYFEKYRRLYYAILDRISTL